MGAAYKTECYPTAADAAAAECAANFPQYVGTVKTACTVQDGGHLLLASPAASSVVGVVYASCTEGEQIADVSQLWGAGLLLLVTLWGFKQLLVRFFGAH